MSTFYDHGELAGKLATIRRPFGAKTFDEIDADAETWHQVTQTFKRRRDACLDRIDQPVAVLEAVLGWYERAARHGWSALLVFGPTGTGKTELAMALLRDLTYRGIEVTAATIADVVASLRPGGDGDVESLIDTGCLFLDDVGAEKKSEFTTAQLFAVVNGRYERQLPTIITTNLTPAAIARHVGERTWSRLKDGATTLSLAGDDRRVAKIQVDLDRPDIESRLATIGALNSCPNRPEMARRIREAGIALPLDNRFQPAAGETIEAICEAVEQEWTERVETLADRVKSWPKDDTRRRLWNACRISYYEPSTGCKPERLAELEQIADQVERQCNVSQQISYLPDSPLDRLGDLVRAAIDAGDLPPNLLQKPLSGEQLDRLEGLVAECEGVAGPEIFGAAENHTVEANAPAA